MQPKPPPLHSFDSLEFEFDFDSLEFDFEPFDFDELQDFFVELQGFFVVTIIGATDFPVHVEIPATGALVVVGFQVVVTTGAGVGATAIGADGTTGSFGVTFGARVVVAFVVASGARVVVAFVVTSGARVVVVFGRTNGATVVKVGRTGTTGRGLIVTGTEPEGMKAPVV
jgi:hypothetical protein